MNKQKNQETNLSFDTDSLRRLFQSAKAHRVIISKSDSSEMVNVSLLMAIIVALIVPELVFLGAVFLFFTEGKVALVRPEATANNDVEPVSA